MSIKVRSRKFLKGKKRKLLLRGDCTKVVKSLPSDSVDSIVTDPPYHLTTGKKGGTGEASLNLNSPAGRSRISTGFMGMSWDGGDVAFQSKTWKRLLRVAKPGAFLLAFSSSRTYHRMATAIEDGGWEIRDCILNMVSEDTKFKRLWESLDASQQEAMAEVLNDSGMNGILAWVYGSGFPKSLNVGKAIDDKLGKKKGEYHGLGTALKPAFEPVIIARKPLEGTVASNVLKYGTGALNIEESRVGWRSKADRDKATPCTLSSGSGRIGTFIIRDRSKDDPTARQSDRGRWPANIIHDGSPSVISGFPQSKDGVFTGSKRDGKRHSGNQVYGKMGCDTQTLGYGGQGSAARFFYCAKVSKSERNEGCDSLPQKTAGEVTGGRKEGSAGLKSPRAGAGRGSGNKNEHPTVKPKALMRYLIQLVTRPGGIVLDPFMGSGSTGVAAMSSKKKKWRFIGIEREEKYMAIAKARILHALKKSKESVKQEPKKTKAPKGMQKLF